jgi:putative membrane protein
MKQVTKHKTLFIQATLLIAVIMSTLSCMNDKKEDSKEVAEERNEAKFENTNNEKDAQFLVNAAEINREEISLGELAKEKGKTLHVKELGKMMVMEHQKSLHDLTALAQMKSITLPESQTDNGKDAYKKLSELPSTDFDKAYADMMVKGHKDAIAIFDKAAYESIDPDIKARAAEMLPYLRSHLDKAIICQKECEKM